FPFALRRFLKHRLTLEEAKQIVRDRMAHREEHFLRMIETSIYGYPRSPYLPLLKMAGCGLGDLRTLVRQEGVEGALRQLRDQGVYVTFEEFKGRQPIVRNGQTIPVTARDFDNPIARREFRFQTGGSTGAASTVASNLDHIAARAPNRVVTLAAHGLLGAPTALWRGILPDRGIGQIFFGALIGNVPQRWFSPFGRRESRSWLKYVLATYYPMLCMRLAGLHVPLPTYVNEDDAIIVARWAADTAKAHGRCLIRTGISRGVRLALAAQANGLDLTGVTLTGGGEPPTLAKVGAINRSGARFVPNYGMSEASQPGSGCVNPVDASDVHLFKDAVALFTHPYHVDTFGVTVPSFNMTTLLPTTPKIMLNVQTDDYGIVEERHCGCELESYGYTTHLRQIRSYSKLTGEGVTLIGTEMLTILNDSLPARFGGSPLDYQLMEAEDAHGFTRLYLIISPRVEINDEQAVVDYMLERLSESSSMADAARVPWQHARTIQIKRTEPVWTERGKLLPLHIPRRHDGSMPQEGNLQ
ncbi:MAG: hypothetical protein ACRD2A_04320, partial [Vicinamibacterales bacterium]